MKDVRCVMRQCCKSLSARSSCRPEEEVQLLQQAPRAPWQACVRKRRVWLSACVAAGISDVHAANCEKISLAQRPAPCCRLGGKHGTGKHSLVGLEETGQAKAHRLDGPVRAATKAQCPHHPHPQQGLRLLQPASTAQASCPGCRLMPAGVQGCAAAAAPPRGPSSVSGARASAAGWAIARAPAPGAVAAANLLPPVPQAPTAECGAQWEDTCPHRRRRHRC